MDFVLPFKRFLFSLAFLALLSRPTEVRSGAVVCPPDQRLCGTQCYSTFNEQRCYDGVLCPKGER